MNTSAQKKIIIIAEIGENHLGDMELAKKMIRQAASAGADIVKFQSYFGKDFRDDDPEKEWFGKVELSNQDHFMLKDFCRAKGVEFLSSPFSLERAKFLCRDLGLAAIKIASGMMLKFPVLDYLNLCGAQTVYLSTGLADLSEIASALMHLDKIPNIYLMHCISQYPCKDKEVNLSAITTLKKEFVFPVGYSDHTIGIDACVAAAALGAKVIEKHFTFDKSCPEGTDHVLSADAQDFKEMVRRINKVEEMLGSGIKAPGPGERQIVNFIRQRFI